MCKIFTLFTLTLVGICGAGTTGAAQPPAGVVPPMPLAGLPGPIVSQPGEMILPPKLVPVAPLSISPVVAAPVLTHEQFARMFQPAPGKYVVVLLHPGSRCPVQVCFDLPAGCPKVIVKPRRLIFDYGRYEVELHFALFGKVKVHYD